MTDLEQLYQDLANATLDSPQGELLSTMLLQGNNEAMPQDVLERFAQLQSPSMGMDIGQSLQQPGPTAANGYFIPEFPTAEPSPLPSPTTVQFKNPIVDAPRDVSAVGANWRDTLNVYERTPSGAIQVRQIKDIPVQQVQKTTAPEFLPTSVFQGVKGLQAITDPIARNEAYANLVGEAEKYKIQIQTNTANQVEAELGIPRLLEAIQLSESRDRRTQDPLGSLVDSPTTQALRKQLDVQRQRASILTEEQLKRNVTLVGLSTQLATAESFIKRQEASDARMTEVEFQKKLHNDAFKEQALLETSPQVIDRALILDPSLQGKAPEDIALHLRKTRRTPEAFVALEAPAERLPRLALIEGNLEAGKILVQEESNRTGEPPELVESKLKQIRKIAEDPKEFQKAATTVLRLSSDELQDIVRKTATAITKEDKAQLRTRKYELALAAYGKLQEASFAANAQGWVGTDTELVGALNTAKQTTGNSDIESVFAAYVGELQGKDRIQKENEFYGKLRGIIAERNKGLLGGIDSQSIIARLQRERAKPLLDTIAQNLPLPLRAVQLAYQNNPAARVFDFFQGE